MVADFGFDDLQRVVWFVVEAAVQFGDDGGRDVGHVVTFVGLPEQRDGFVLCVLGAGGCAHGST